MASEIIERIEEKLEKLRPPKKEEERKKKSPWEVTLGIIGAVAFFGALALSVVGGFVAAGNPAIILSLIVLGLIVSLLNISTREGTPVLVAAIALIVGAAAGVFTPLDTLVGGLGTSVNNVIIYFATFMIPVAIVTAIRMVIRLARPGEKTS